MPISLSHIIQSTGAELYGQAHVNESCIIEEFYFDTRKIFHPKAALFLCLSQDKEQLLNHISIAESKGINFFLIPSFIHPQSPNSLFLKVPHVLEAFQLLAKAQRKKSTAPIVGITGSNGKTIIKEWLATVLEPHYNLLKSPASYNSQLGVPLSVSQLTPEHEIAIFEAGISQVGEMDKLEKIIQPTIGILSNIGDAHSEGFTDNTEKLSEKLKLFKHAQWLILEETPTTHKKNIEAQIDANCISWSIIDTHADNFITLAKSSKQTSISIHNKNELSFSVHFTDTASIKNSIHVILCCLHLGLHANEIQVGLDKLEPVSMRLSMIKAKNNSLIINDSYNADMTSLVNALEFATNQRQNRALQIILTDFDQINDNGSTVSEILRRFPLDKIHYIGKHFAHEQENATVYNYQSIDDVKTFFHYNPLENTLLLLKGARRFQLETLVNRFRRNVHRTQLTISLSAINHNIGLFRQLTGPNTEIMAVIKASAYGSDSISLAKEIIKQGVNRLAVAYYEEAKELREEGITAPIMIMNPDPVFSNLAEEYKLELEVYSTAQLQAILDNGGSTFNIHLKIDSGMNRLGFSEQELPELIRILKSNPSVKVLSIFSHFAAAEDPEEDTFTKAQHDNYLRLYSILCHELFIQPKKHICNSNAAIRFPEFHHDMIRIGIGLYGYIENLETKIAHRLSSYVAQVKEIHKGDSVGYNRSFIAEKNLKIATVSVGYADGLSRKLGKGAYKFQVGGKYVPTVGNISMDTCSIDITGLDVEAGDEVIVFDTFEQYYEMAKVSELTPYELINAIGPRVSHEFVKE